MTSGATGAEAVALRAPWWRRAVAASGLDLIALGLFSLVLGVLALVYRGTLHFIEGSVIWPFVVLCGIVTVSFVTRARGLLARDPAVRREVRGRALGTVRDWLPVILLVLVYENLRSLTGLIRPVPIDMQLWALDVRLFGVEPTLWAQRFVNPWLTDYFAFAYVLYFIIPLTLATTLYLRGRRDDFRELMLGVVLVMYTGFLLFIIFPAGPPRFSIAHLFDPPRLTGRFGFFEATQGAWDSLNPIKVHASFPSLHCALSATALFYAWRFRRGVGGAAMFACFLPLVVSLWLSTIYLRHHWIVDSFAGIGLAALVYALTPRLRRVHAALSAARPAAAPPATPAAAAASRAAAAPQRRAS
ncbi:MAG TPA: phosphatase PAP2 family protein [Polyangia bacterium]|jgi:membrane-associated phospholipid phosphatase